MALAYICGELVLKNLVGRARPFSAFPEMLLLIPASADYSFPSGHTSSSFASASLFRYKRSWGVLAIIAAMIPAALIAFSRMYLFVHYPGDVMAGILLGIGMSFSAIPIARPLMNAAEKIWGPE